jgi:hypothetical protein
VHLVKKSVGALLMLLVAAIAYLLAWPVPVQPVVWSAPVDAGYTGVHTPNRLLAGLQTIPLNGEDGPEHVALGPDGKLYPAVASGALLRMDPDGSGQEVFARTGGRVLGFDFDATGAWWLKASASPTAWPCRPTSARCSWPRPGATACGRSPWRANG